MAILETSRLILRPFQEEDLDRLAELMADPNFMRFSTGIYSREQAGGFLDKILGWERAGLPSQFAVILRATGEMLGYSGFYHQHIDGVDEIEIGYRLDSAYWNQGIGTEAAMAVRDHGFGDLELARVISLIQHDNVPSRRVAEKIGMTLEKETVYKNFLVQVFAISREKWLATDAV